ncbi:LLM class flavin-dependent oxidoreductase [Xylophilus sp.]|uniref:LLM class flavin-dependent oxidoreductase n=1 Tax=Xylophilus sp. TaxID=2653893 RepID=UPI0013BB53F8|nr:LLM class flavin-dependent oxidoreductase [Xylophilus sp.]KAF1047549.1 MAG: Nitrilotriacetate monooxygenase component A [Xylophilus sp.]
MTTPQRQLSIGMNILGFGAHAAAYRLGEVPPTAQLSADYFVNIARISEERGTLDAIFLADGPALPLGERGNGGGRGPLGKLEPTVLLTAVALATRHIGVIATASSSYNEPYNIARRFSSIDHLTGGRAAWNVVTNAGDAAAQNFGLGGAPVHADRYARADEFLEVVTKLWDSWEDDAIQPDQGNNVFADTGRIHPINHVGRYFSVKGALTVPRTPQGRPVLVQAGSSEGGKALGSRWADAIFTTQTTLADGQAFYREMKERARRWGRNPDHLKIMPGLSTVIGSTEEEAVRRFDKLNAFIGEQGLARQVAGRIGIPVDQLDPDAPLPWDRIGPVTAFERGSHGFLEAQLNLARRENLTVRQLSRRILVGHRLVVGSPEQVADTIEEWFRAGAADGFNIMPDAFNSGVEIFVDEVVPLLRKRGIFRHEYTAGTLRGHLGLPYPGNRYTLARQATAA